MFHEVHGFGMLWGWVVGILILAAIVIIIVRVVGRQGGEKQAQGRAPLDILKERYAKGEIDQIEFEERKKHLES